MHYFYKIWLSLILLFLPLFLTAQETGTVRGYVNDEQSGEPMVFTNVRLERTDKGASTDMNGFFSIPNVEPGEYTLFSTYIGYDTVRKQVQVEEGEIVNVRITLKESDVELQTVEVSAREKAKKREVQVSTTKLEPEQLKQMPTIGGEPDLVQYLQVLPGVVSTGDQGGQLYIRGGSPIQTKFLQDGLTIYNPFHSIGLFSVYETEIIRNIEVLTGGFNAEYGGRISAVVDVTTRDGNKKELDGMVSVSPFMAKGVLEGPISKLNDKGNSISYILTGKHSYLDQSSKTIYNYVDTAGIPYGFTDLYGKLSINTGSGSNIDFFGFHYRDNATFRGVTEFGWRTTGVGMDFRVVPGQSQTVIDGNVSYSDYQTEVQEADERPKESAIRGFNVGLDFLYFLDEGELKYGFDVNGFKTIFEFYNSLGLKVDQNQNTTELGGYVKYRKKFGNLVIEPSLRLQFYASLAEFSPEPRLGLKYNISDNVRVKLGSGIYSQNLISSSSDRDVVNLFNGFLSGPEENLTNTDGETSNSKLQRAAHVITGLEWDVMKNLEANIEPYYKRFFQLISINRQKLFASQSNFMIENGDAYGIDLSLRYRKRGFYAYAAYSLGYVERSDGEQTYNPNFDRRHSVNIVSSYTFGKNQGWEASVRWNLGSGFPFTKTQGFYEKLRLNEGVGDSYQTENGEIGTIFDDNLNEGRLPYYHRLDASIKKKFFLSTNVTLTADASVSNIYNRKNIFYFDRVRYKRVNQLPILPTAGLSLSF